MQLDLFYCGKKYPERGEAADECTCPSYSKEDNPEGCSTGLQGGQAFAGPCRYTGVDPTGFDYTGVCLPYKDPETKECWPGPTGTESEDCCNVLVDETLCKPDICATTQQDGKTAGPCIFNYQEFVINEVTKETQGFGICMPYIDLDGEDIDRCPTLSSK